MATEWISPTWRMPNDKNQSKFENYSLDFAGASLEHVMLGNGGNDTDLLPGQPTVAGTVNNPNFSVSAFFNFDSAISGSLRNIIGAGKTGGATNWYLRKNASDNIEFTVRNEVGSPYYVTVTGSTVLNSDQWYHAAVSWDGTTITLYLDGTSEATAAATTFYFGGGPGTEWPTIGSYYRGATTQSSLWDGKIAQPCIFDYALSQGQVDYLYNLGTPQNPMAISGQPPVAYYPLGGSSTGSASTLTIPNESVPDATVFDFESGSTTFIKAFDVPVTTFTEATFSTWVNFETVTGTYQYVMGMGSGPGNFMSISKNNTSGTWYTYDGTGSDYTASTPVANRWYHVVVTQTGTTRRFYIDGIEDANSPFTVQALAIPYDNLTLGAYNNSSSATPSVLYKLDGQLSNTQVWNTALESSEITTLYNNGVPLFSGTQPQAANLKAWYKLNVDTSTWDGSDWIIGEAQANYSSALDFDGSGYITISPNTFDATNGLTMSCWVRKSSTVTGTNWLCSKGNTGGVNSQFNTRLASGDAWFNYFNGGSTYTGISGLGDGRWHHIAQTVNYSTGDVMFYKDGVPSSTVLTWGSAYAVATLSQISTSFYPFEGDISNFAIFSSALSTPNIVTLYNNGTPEVTPSFSPTSWWKLDNTTTGIQDSGSASNNGTNNGATVTDIQVSTLNGTSSGMNTANLVNSDLTRSIPYSSYSMDFEELSSQNIDIGSSTLFDSTSAFSFSTWCKLESYDNSFPAFIRLKTDQSTGFIMGFSNNATYYGVWFGSNSNFLTARTAGDISADLLGVWKHISLVYDGVDRTAISSYSLYINGVPQSLVAAGSFGATPNTNVIGQGNTASTFWDGLLSNVSVFNTTLTQDQILTIYNGGVPNSISSLSPVGWWSLAGDSYYNGTDWICPDLGSGSNNGTSSGMGGSELVGEGPGSSANGIATSMDIPANLKGDAPNSSSNAFSVNMDTADRVASVPS